MSWCDQLLRYDPVVLLFLSSHSLIEFVRQQMFEYRRPGSVSLERCAKQWLCHMSKLFFSDERGKLWDCLRKTWCLDFFGHSMNKMNFEGIWRSFELSCCLSFLRSISRIQQCKELRGRKENANLITKNVCGCKGTSFVYKCLPFAIKNVLIFVFGFFFWISKVWKWLSGAEKSIYNI